MNTCSKQNKIGRNKTGIWRQILIGEYLKFPLLNSSLIGRISKDVVGLCSVRVMWSKSNGNDIYLIVVLVKMYGYYNNNFT